MQELMKGTDVAPMWDAVAYNAGFIVLRPTPSAVELYKLIRQMTTASRSMDDQGALNRAIGRLKRGQDNSTSNSTFQMKLLSREKFLSGRAYFELGRRLLPKEKDCNPANELHCPLVVHNNWLVSKNAKVYRFREHLMWMHEENQYYSSATRSYLTYVNPKIFEANVSNQLSSLKAALAIGRLCNRTVILPRFLCWNKAGTTIANECPLNSLIRIPRFEACFKDQFRESSFLKHPKVPMAVRLGSQVHLLQPQTNTTTSLHLKSRFIQQQLCTSTAKVLNVGSLLGVNIIFDNKLQGKAFYNDTDTCFRRGSYRQY